MPVVNLPKMKYYQRIPLFKYSAGIALGTKTCQCFHVEIFLNV